MKCERCNGSGTMLITGFVHYTSGCRQVSNEPMPCLDCRGTGERSELEMKIKRIGQHIREWRKENDMTLREQSKITGIPFSVLNNIQNGRIEG